ncbi:cingulin-like protein 1 [Liolophura sinensis]|uniref:cingulin-like protein 1 n=1 Tax=Liolophura sinensis TaxID=3198878 RepID=UPI003159220C
MEGFDADAEWSEDEIIKSGSATGKSPGGSATALSDSDYDDDTVPPGGVVSPQLTVKKDDPVDKVLDKIDSELGDMSSLKKSSALDHSLSSEKPLFVNVAHLNQSQEDNLKDSEKTGTDTGLGTGSLTSDADPLLTPPATTNTTAMPSHVGIPATKDKKKNTTGGSGLDFLQAKEVDEKFQEVLSRKKGGYLEDLQTAPVLSDQETIKTEDFEAKFNECLIPATAGGKTEQAAHCHTKSDTSDELEAEFDRALAKLTESLPAMTDRRMTSLHKRSYSGGALELKKLTMSHPFSPPRKPAQPQRRKKDTRSASPRRPPSGKPPHTEYLRSPRAGYTLNSSGYTSDLESIKTEDFETIFQNLLVKQRPGISVVNHASVDPKSMTISHETNSTLARFLQCKDADKTVDKSKLTQNKVELGVGIHSWTGKRTINRGTEEKDKMDAGLSQKSYTMNGFRGHPEATSHNGPGYSAENDKMFRSGAQSDGQTDPYEQTDEEVARNAREIEQQSAVIQKEMEAERKMKTSLPSVRREVRASGQPGVKNVEFEMTCENDIDGDIDMKQRELHRLDENIKGCHADLKRLETLVKERREQAEDARTQLMLTEFKRDNAVKELEKSNQELYVKRNKVKAFDEEVKVKMEQMKQIDSLGITMEEVQALMNDRECYQSQTRHLDALQLERNELIRQLDSVKQALFAERKHARSEKDELVEEMENLKTRLEEIQGERDELHQNLVAMEMALQKVEKEKAMIVQEKSQLFKDLQEKAKRESFNLQRQTERENEQQSLKFGEMAAQILRLEEDVRVRDEAIIHLRGQLESAAQKLLEEHQKREGTQEDHRKTLQSLRKDTDTALKQVKESCFLEKQRALETLRGQLEEEKRESLVKCEDRMTRRLAELGEKAAVKDDQIQKLEDQLQQVREKTRRETEKIKEASVEQAQTVIRKERQVLENERDWLKQREREAATSEMKRKLTSITEELECRDAQVKQLKEEILRLEKELEEQKSLVHDSVKDKLQAVARAKDQAQMERQADMETLRDTVIKENKAEIQTLREMIDRQGEELNKLRSIKMTNERNEKEKSSALDRTERTLINEINEECRRTAAVLGLAPRKIHIMNFQSGGTELSVPAGHRRKVTTSALANLRACNEELRSQVMEMSQMVESQRSALMYAQRDKDDAIDQIKKKMEQEKLHEMDSLKERLIKDQLKQQFDDKSRHQGATYDNNYALLDM